MWNYFSLKGKNWEVVCIYATFLKMKWVIMFKLKSAVLPANKEAESPDGLFYSILLYCQCFSHFFLFFCCLTTLFVPIGTVYFIDVSRVERRSPRHVPSAMRS